MDNIIKNFEIVEPINTSRNNVNLIKVFDRENKRFLMIKEIIDLDRLGSLLFEKELSALNLLKNYKHIVELYKHDILIDKSKNLRNGYIILEYIVGENLQKYDLTQLITKEKYKIVLQLIEAVNYAHSHKIIHRDIKPSNIVIEDNSLNVKVIDFGISKIYGILSNNGTLNNFSSNIYTAPEVRYHDENSTFASDIYSLGMTIYYLLTGKEPPKFNLSNTLEIQDLIDESIDINYKMKPVLKKCVNIDLEQRYKNTIDLLSDLYIVSKDLTLINSYKINVDKNIIGTIKRRKIFPKCKDDLSIISKLNLINNEKYAFIESDIDSEADLIDNIKICSNNYQFECIFTTETSELSVKSITKTNKKYFSKLKNYYLKVNDYIEFKESHRNNDDLSINNEFINDLIDFKYAYDLQKNKIDLFNKFFGIWSDYLDKYKLFLEENALKIKYTNFNKNSDKFLFEIEEILGDEEDLNKEILFIFDSELNGNKKSKLIPIGYFLDIAYESEKSYLVLNDATIKANLELPRTGIIASNYSQEKKSIERQLDALNFLKNNRGTINPDLLDIVLGVKKPTSIPNISSQNPINTILDDNQLFAVKKALETDSICLIQGPPGTGKTSVIREIINQIISLNSSELLHKKMKILVVSQSNPAVDNVLDNFKGIDDIDVIRIGRSNKIIDRIWEKYSVYSF